MTAGIVALEKRFRLAGILLIAGLLVEAICLLWARPLDFIHVAYLYSLVSTSEANRGS